MEMLANHLTGAVYSAQYIWRSQMCYNFI